MAESRMTWKVRGIIKIYDSYIRRPASTASLQIRTDQGLSVIRKSEGILVFVENHNFTDRGPVQVVLESPLFLRETVVLPLDSDPEVQVVWLRPGNQYPAGGGSSRIYGSAAPGTEISFAFTGGPDSMKLLRDLKVKDKEISIYHPGIRSLEGCTLELELKRKRGKIRLEKCLDDSRTDTGTCRFQGEQLSGTYQKMDTVVRNVQEARAGEDGAYLLLFKTVPEPVSSGRLWWKEPETGRTGELRVNVREGGSVRQDLL